MKKSLLRNDAVQTILGSILCIILGLLVGFVVLLVINPQGATEAIVSILKNYLYYPSPQAQLKYLGTTLVKSSALLMCSLSVLFAWKVGLFNIGAAGQYVVGAGACIYLATALNCPWYVCLLAAAVVAALVGALSGLLKAIFNVNEVISSIMLNWIGLYCVNMLLTKVKDTSTPYSKNIKNTNASALLPNLGLNELFSKNEFVTVGIIIAVICAIIIWIILDKTKLGYELKATGMNKNAAQYCGMHAKRNIVLTMAIAGALAGIGAGIFYLTNIEQWMVQQSSVPSMGFNGIAAAFLGGVNPIGTIFSSYFIQHITSGGTYVDTSMYSPQISDLISAFIIYLCGFVLFFKLWLNKMLNKAEEKKLAATKKEGGEA